MPDITTAQRVGRNVKARRLALRAMHGGWTQTECATMAGCSQGTWADYEAGARHVTITVDVVERLASILQCSAGDLLKGASNE